MLTAIAVSAFVTFAASRESRIRVPSDSLDPDYVEWAWHVGCYGTTLAVCASAEEALRAFLDLWEEWPAEGLTIERYTTGTYDGLAA